MRNRNQLMLAAGFAPTYRERPLDDPALSSVRAAVDRIIQAHEPYPALVFDWRHDVIAANASAMRLQTFLFGVDRPEDLPSIAGNVLRGLIHPDGYRNHIGNWDHVTATMLRRLRAEVLAAGSTRDGVELLEELSAYDGVPTTWRQCPDLDWQEPMLPIEIVRGDKTIRLFSTLTSLGAPFEVTLQETRIESFFPMDPESEAFFR
ncbi:MAG: transcriptional regulator [Pseudomonadota bacterium]